MKGWAHSQEDIPGLHDRPGMEDIILDGIADILWQWQGRDTTGFAADPNEGIVPVDIVKTQTGDIADTQGKPGK